jgi:hypothetical protein
MTSRNPSAFDVGRATSNNIAGAFRQNRDTQAIDSILSQAVDSGDPKMLQSSIGQILSQVSPERQQDAIKVLEGSYNRVLESQKLKRSQEAARQAGINADLPPAVQAAQFKENAKNQRINNAQNVFNGQQQNAGMQQNSPQQQVQPPFLPGQQPNQSPQAKNAPNDPKARKRALLSLTGHPDMEVREQAKAELRQIEADEKNDRADARGMRKETQKLREEYANKASIAQQSIQEKEQLLGLIDTGKIDDPTLAVLFDAIPMKLGQRFLSKETVQYKGGLVNGYRDLRNIFSGATRVKEIDLLEQKIADIYLTDEQKKAMLKSSLNTLQYDVIKADAAAEVEKNYPHLGVLEFTKKVNELAKPKIDALANRIIDEQKYFIKDAENRKKIPLDYDDPEGRQILDQILQEAGGNRAKARDIAKKKGYTIGK